MTGRNIARYMRVKQLEKPLKERLGGGTASDGVWTGREGED